MRVLVASDKYKGSLSGMEACEAIAAGLAAGFGEGIECRLLPVADGGEGMSRAITEAMSGEWVECDTRDPLGRPVTAGYGLVDGSAVAAIEMAEASGLWRVNDADRDPWTASTFGTGQMIRHAMSRGADRILLGIGGSATDDGGTGMARALGFVFRDAEGNPIEDLPAHLERASRIEFPEVSALPRVTVACDVANPLLGPDGCSRIYGPQKGVPESDFSRHEARLRHLVGLLGKPGAEAAEMPGAGAAGGLGFGCLALLGADLRPGFDLVAGILGLESAVAVADLVITGEGRLDSQTLQGKAPAGVARMAKKLGKPVVAFAGSIPGEARASLRNCFDLSFQVAPSGVSTAESMKRAGHFLFECARREAEKVRSLVKR
jgi:glycerate kinase